MLKALELENFKAFGERTRIEFAPITLIFGENSAGKSSILHSVNLLKQTRESREHGALLLPRAEAGFVDLGSFQELLFDHDLSRTLSVRLSLDTSDGRYYRKRPPSPGAQDDFKEVAIEMSFSRPSDAQEVQLGQLQLFLSDPDPIARFEPIELDKEQQQLIARDWYMVWRGRRRVRRPRIAGAKCAWISPEPKYWHSRYTAALEKRGDITRNLRNRRKEFMVELDRLPVPDRVRATDRHSAERMIDDAITFYGSEFTETQFIERMRSWESTTIVGLEGFIPFPVRGGLRFALPELFADRRGPMYRPNFEAFTLDCASLLCDAGRYVESWLESLFPMGPFRRPPERWYVFTGTSPQDVGYRGDLLPDLLFRRPDLQVKANEWLERLQIGYRLQVESIGGRSRDLFEMRLQDTRRGKSTDVGLADVGYGISQILPFVVQSLATENQVISIEQPEVHIHPRLQADLGDLLAEAIKEPRKNRFIVETHSEHLILRLQKLVRGKVLQPDDVSVIYVSRGAMGAVARRLRLDENGDFQDEWPGGFFPERLKELM